MQVSLYFSRLKQRPVLLDCLADDFLVVRNYIVVKEVELSPELLEETDVVLRLRPA